MRRTSPPLAPVVLILTILAAAAAAADTPDCFPYETTSAWSEPLGLDEAVVAIAGAEGLLACATETRLILVDVSDPRAPAVLGSTELAAPATTLTICGAHVVVGGALAHLYDIADPGAPVLLASVDLFSAVRDLAAGPHWLAAVTEDGGLHVWRRPLAPTFAADWTVAAAGHVHGVAAWQDRLIAAAEELVILVVPAAGEPGMPTVERTLWPAPDGITGRPLDLAVSGDLALVSFEWWIPVAGHDGGRDQTFEPMVAFGVDLAPAAVPVAVAGQALVVAGREDLADGPWLRPALRFPATLDTRLTAAGDLLVRLDAGVVRLLDTAPITAPSPLVRPELADPSGKLIGRWTTTDAVANPGASAFDRHLWYHGDPLAPRLIATLGIVFDWDFGHGYELVAADGDLALVEAWDTGGPYALHLYDAAEPDPVATPLPVTSSRPALRGPRLVVLDGSDLICVDLGDPQSPRLAGSLSLAGLSVSRVDFIGADRVLATGSADLVAVDVDDLDDPAIATVVPRDGLGLVGEIAGRVLMRRDGTLEIRDRDLAVLGAVAGQGPVSAAAARGDLLAVAWRDEGVDLVDLADPAQPMRRHWTVPLEGRYVYQLAFGEPASGGEVVHLATGENGTQVALLHPRHGGRVLGGTGGYATSLAMTDAGVLTPTALWPRQCGVVTSAGPQRPAAAPPLLTVAPNPFNPRTRIRFAVPRSGPVTLSLLDLRGRLVRRLATGPLAAGEHTRVWDGTDGRGRPVSAGVYLLHLQTVAGAATGRLALVR